MENVNRKLVNMYDIISCLTNANDLVSPKLVGHHQKVAYLAFKIGEELNLPKSQQKNLVLAGLLHDVGALSSDEMLPLIEGEPPNVQDHAYRGAGLIEGFQPFIELASIIRYHHVPWNNGEGKVFMGQQVSILSHILHLVEHITVSIDHNYEVLGQVKNIINKILGQKNAIFMPELVDAFINLSVNESIWLDMANKSLFSIMPNIMVFDTMDLDMEEVINLTKVFSNIIDFRSPFTPNHTAGVAKTAEKLAELAGFSENECKMILVAGYLHDLGKLAIRHDILEKPSKLDVEEFNIIRSHTYYTYRLLQPIKEFETINCWASYHHEKLNGKGYPFHLDDKNLPLGSRIMAVADIFTAITEDRPYRKGMPDGQVVNILKSMVNDRSICPYVVSILIDNFDLINEIRKEAQREASIEYNYFINYTYNEAIGGIR